jgi:hypothetical protein
VISLPSDEDELSQLVDELSGDLTGVQTVQDVAQAKRFNPKVSASLGPFKDVDIFDRLQRIRDGAKSDATRSPKLSEFDTFANGRPEIGANHPTAKLYAQTLSRGVWEDPEADIDLSPIKNLVAVHRLREVSCLYGFTRFEAAPTAADGDIEDIQLSVRGAPISRDADWLPAIEQFGEGIFIHFDEVAIGEWLRKEPTALRNQKLLAGYGHWQRRFAGKAPPYPGTQYVLLHSISHALMAEIALDCGYPASSLKERVYALSTPREAPAISTGAASSFTLRAPALRALSEVSSRPPQDLRISSKAHWIASGFVQMIPYVPITNRTTGVVIERPTGLRAMDAY